MVTIDRQQGFRIVIYTNDHAPAHVHAINADGEAKINLIGPDGDVELIWAVGMKRSAVRAAVRIVQENRETYLADWMAIHA